MTSRFITEKELRKYPNSAEAQSWAGAMVHIQTEHGVWRTGGAGYTTAGNDEAWVLPLDEARAQVAHCWEDKRAAFIRGSPESEKPPRPCPNPWCNSHKSETPLHSLGLSEVPLSYGRVGHRMQCNSCGLRGPVEETRAAAHIAWNTRKEVK